MVIYLGIIGLCTCFLAVYRHVTAVADIVYIVLGRGPSFENFSTAPRVAVPFLESLTLLGTPLQLQPHAQSTRFRASGLGF